MAARLTPPEFVKKDGQPPIPPQVAAQLQQAQRTIQELGEQLRVASGELETKKLEMETKERVAAMHVEVDKQRIQAESAIVAMQTESKEALELLRLEFRKMEKSMEMLVAQGAARTNRLKSRPHPPSGQ